jgi:PAS domain S-box-containing protein
MQILNSENRPAPKPGESTRGSNAKQGPDFIGNSEAALESVPIGDLEGRPFFVELWGGGFLASEVCLRTAFELAPLGVVVVDREGRVLDCNPSFARMLGYSRQEVLSRRMGDFTYPEDAAKEAALFGKLAAGRHDSYEAESRYLRKDGRVVWGHLIVSRQQGEGDRSGASATAILQDVTERKRLEEQFLQAQKMEPLGRLAMGIVHDFNNLLTVVLGYGQILLERLALPDPACKLLQQMTAAAERGTLLTRHLLTFSRQQALTLRVLDLNALLADLAAVLRHLIGEDIRLEAAPLTATGTVRADPVLLEQVVLNLVVNARDAMPRGGSLRLATRDVNLDAADARAHPGARPGPHVLLEVSDTGCGMTEEVRARIFEPFFTTKEASKGTGLGLATVSEIVRQSEGYVEVESAPGKGATFRISLPRFEEKLPEPGLGSPGRTVEASCQPAN